MVKDKKSLIKDICFSFLATIGIVFIYSNYAEKNIYNNFINIIIFSGIVSLYSSLKNKEKYTIFSIIFSVFLSLILVLGTQLELFSNIYWNFHTLLNILTLPFAIYPIIKIITNSKIIFKEDLKSNKFLKIFIIIFGLNIIAFLAAYPGIYHYDAAYQMIEVTNDNILVTTHFSYLYCLIFGKIVYFGHEVFNSYTFGFALFIFLQSTLLSFVYTKITLFSNERFKNKLINVLLILFFGIFPLITVMTLSATQDILFAAFFALTFIYLYKFIEDEDFIKNKCNIIKFILYAFLLMAFRNNGIYVLLFSFPFSIVLLKNKKYTLICFIIPILLFEGYNKLLLPNIGVKKAPTIREMSSVPSQQFARVYTYDEIDADNFEKLQKFYNLENFNYYKINPSISDLMKGGLNNDYTEKHLGDYAKLWVNIGVKHPINYIEAFLLNTLGYWYPNKDYYDSRIYHNYAYYNMLDAKVWNKEYIDIDRYSLIKPYDTALEYTFEKNTWKYIPMINSLFTIGFYFIIILYSLIINLINKNKNILVPYSIIIGLYLTLLLSPVAMLRYFFPILILIPIILSDINIIKKTNKD